VAIQFTPLAHSGGLFALVTALYYGRPVALFEKFEPAAWADAVAQFRPRSASLVPTMINMVLDADIAPERLRSLAAGRSGTGPLDPVGREAFETRYGVPILIDYGASEFIGGVAGWTMADHRSFGRTKRASV